MKTNENLKLASKRFIILRSQKQNIWKLKKRVRFICKKFTKKKFHNGYFPVNFEEFSKELYFRTPLTDYFYTNIYTTNLSNNEANLHSLNFFYNYNEYSLFLFSGRLFFKFYLFLFSISFLH